MAWEGRKHVLYLGTDLAHYQGDDPVIHYPMIKIIPLPIPSHIWDDFSEYTHLIFTSKNGVSIFIEAARKKWDTMEPFKRKKIIAIGRGTAEKLLFYQLIPDWIAVEERQEGIAKGLEAENPKNPYVFYPRSSRARPYLSNFLSNKGIRHAICNLYQTIFQRPKPHPDFQKIHEIIFTSPSTVEAFIAAFGFFPSDVQLSCIGPITQLCLDNFLKKGHLNDSPRKSLI